MQMSTRWDCVGRTDDATFSLGLGSDARDLPQGGREERETSSGKEQEDVEVEEMTEDWWS